MSVQTVLITGGAGYVGSHVAVELLTAGYTVIVVDNREEAVKGRKAKQSPGELVDLLCFFCLVFAMPL